VKDENYDGLPEEQKAFVMEKFNKGMSAEGVSKAFKARYLIDLSKDQVLTVSQQRLKDITEAEQKAEQKATKTQKKQAAKVKEETKKTSDPKPKATKEKAPENTPTKPKETPKAKPTSNQD